MTSPRSIRLLAAAFGIAGVGGAALPVSAEKPWTLVVSGDAEGYLAPCGCSSPQIGGIRRKASAVKEFAKDSQIAFLDTGGFAKGIDRQSELKAETLAQAMATLDAAAVHLTPAEARMGKGMVASLARLSGGRFVTTALAQGSVEGVRPFIERGPFLIGGATSQERALGAPIGLVASSADSAAGALILAAKTKSKRPVLMLYGSRADAQELARKHPSLGAIVFRSPNDPPAAPEKVGNVLLLTPGEKGKSLVRLRYDGKSFGGYSVVKLGPQFADDPEVASIYKFYLRRVDNSGLLERLPRQPSDPFAGNEACGKCHGKAMDVWKASSHSQALKTLEDDGHSRDPDCVGCHVVGLTSIGGFESRVKTPHLTDVGCESCHGAGANHSGQPLQFPMPKIGKEACVSCHNPEHSTQFDFDSYWKRIAH